MAPCQMLPHWLLFLLCIYNIYIMKGKYFNFYFFKSQMKLSTNAIRIKFQHGTFLYLYLFVKILTWETYRLVFSGLESAVSACTSKSGMTPSWRGVRLLVLWLLPVAPRLPFLFAYSRDSIVMTRRSCRESSIPITYSIWAAILCNILHDSTRCTLS